MLTYRKGIFSSSSQEREDLLCNQVISTAPNVGQKIERKQRIVLNVDICYIQQEWKQGKYRRGIFFIKNTA